MATRILKKISLFGHKAYSFCFDFLKVFYKKLGKSGTALLGLVAIFTFIIQIFPEPVSNITKYLYEKTRLDKPDLIFEFVNLDDVSGFYGSDNLSGKCSPFYYSVSGLNLKYQHLIADNPYHELSFDIRSNNNVTNGDIFIKNIKVKVIDKRSDLKKERAEIDCGGAGSWKVYTIIPEQFKNIIDKGEGSVNAIVDLSDNEEPFDFLVLNKDSSQESIKLKLPMETYGVVGLEIIVEAQYKNKIYYYTLDKIYIANSQESESIMNKIDNPELFIAKKSDLIYKFQQEKNRVLLKVSPSLRLNLRTCLDAAFNQYLEIIKLNSISDNDYQTWQWSEDVKQFTDDKLKELENKCYSNILNP